MHSHSYFIQILPAAQLKVITAVDASNVDDFSLPNVIISKIVLFHLFVAAYFAINSFFIARKIFPVFFSLASPSRRSSRSPICDRCLLLCVFCLVLFLSRNVNFFSFSHWLDWSLFWAACLRFYPFDDKKVFLLLCRHHHEKSWKMGPKEIKNLKLLKFLFAI